MDTTTIENSVRVTGYTVRDIRFPTSDERYGSDALNSDPDYSCAYLTLTTNRGDLSGHGLLFTIGRGNEVCCLALESLAEAVVGKSLASIVNDFAGFSRELTGDPQMRWLGPEKGVIHMAAGTLLNAVWDLYARLRQQPLWLVLATMTPRQVVDSIDFSYLMDALTPDEALHMLQEMDSGKEARIAALLSDGFPAYTTSVGWLGFTDEQIKERCQGALAEGWTNFKIKVGGSSKSDIRRAALVRDLIGPACRLMLDANQSWEVPEAIEKMRELARFDPYWIEEPTSPDDVLGHKEISAAIAPVLVASGEHCQNRIIFKQLLSLGAIGVCQIDSCRVAGVNENLAIMLLAKKFGVPVCPHGGGVGLCEQVQHLAMFDFVAVSGTLQGRLLEYVEHLHEHFVDPVRVENGRYLAPEQPGYSVEMKQASLDAFEFPGGPVWSARRALNTRP